MISINESANTIDELKLKVCNALGIQMEFDLKPSIDQILESPVATGEMCAEYRKTHPDAGMHDAKKAVENSLAGLVEGNKAPRTRRTKAEIEAERQSKNAVATTAGEKIDNNFKAADAEAEVDADPMGEEPAKVFTMDDCKAAGKKIMALSGGTDKLIALVKTFGKEQVIKLEPTQFADFVAKADALAAGV